MGWIAGKDKLRAGLWGLAAAGAAAGVVLHGRPEHLVTFAVLGIVVVQDCRRRAVEARRRRWQGIADGSVLSSAGHLRALVRANTGRVQELGQQHTELAATVAARLDRQDTLIRAVYSLLGRGGDKRAPAGDSEQTEPIRKLSAVTDLKDEAS